MNKKRRKRLDEVERLISEAETILDDLLLKESDEYAILNLKCALDHIAYAVKSIDHAKEEPAQKPTL